MENIELDTADLSREQGIDLSAHPLCEKIFLVTGGTGGHVFPAQAVAQELLKRGIKPFIMTDRRGIKFKSHFPELKMHLIFSSSPSGRLFKMMRSFYYLFVGFVQSLFYILKYRPKVILGFGGYMMVPTVMAAHICGVKILLHEQNAYMGKANRFLSRFAQKVITSFESVKGFKKEGQEQEKTTFLGNPVREEILSHLELEAKQVYSIPEQGPIHILVLGGSLGAKIFSDVIPEAISLLSAELREKIQLVCQARAEELEEVKTKLYPHIKNYEVKEFFRDVGKRIAASHLVICRAGSSTLNEVCALGRPMIMVPFKLAADDHQTMNAKIVEDQGGGWVMSEENFTAKNLALRLETLLNLSQHLEKAAQEVKKVARVKAHQDIADLILEFCQ